MMGGANAHYDGIKAFSETDQTDDLKAITVPTLVMQGDDDQIVPYKDAVLLQAKLIKHSTLKIYPGYPHGMLTTHADVIKPGPFGFRPQLAALIPAPRSSGPGSGILALCLMLVAYRLVATRSRKGKFVPLSPSQHRPDRPNEWRLSRSLASYRNDENGRKAAGVGRYRTYNSPMGRNLPVRST